MKNVLVILIATIMVSANLVAQEVSFEEAKPYLAEFERFIEIPNEYSFHSVKKVKVDEISAYLFLYEKNENKGLNGEFKIKSDRQKNTVKN